MINTSESDLAAIAVNRADEIHRLMMPDGHKGRDRDMARSWNSALKAIESFAREH